MSASPPDSTVHVEEDEVLPAFAAVFGEHRHDCATFAVTSGRGDFTAQFATGTPRDTPAWNLARDPPRTRVMGYEELDRSSNYIEIRSDASTPAEALVELRDIVGQVGGEHSRVRLSQTERIAKLSPREMGRHLIDIVRGMVNRGGRA